jgi:hypothetical protein
MYQYPYRTHTHTDRDSTTPYSVIHINSGETKTSAWFLDPHYQYIGRRHAWTWPSGQRTWLDGYFGNPVHVGTLKCPVCGRPHADRGSTLPCYERHARLRLATDLEFKMRVKALQGKALICWCAPNVCHGDVLWDLCRELNSGMESEWVCVWPDDTWCWQEDVESCCWKSDDYLTIPINPLWSENDVYDLVARLNHTL